MRYKVSIIGHFDSGRQSLDGQTIKTRIIADALQKEYGERNVSLCDTCDGLSFLLKLPFLSFWNVLRSENVVMMTAQKGVLFVPFWLFLWNLFYHRQLIYVTIGGWLPDLLRKHRLVRYFLSRFDCIFVETAGRMKMLSELGLNNVCIMPNCKFLNILSSSEIVHKEYDTLRLCTFSRVVKTKGIEEAIEAVKLCRNQYCKEVFLDIYGRVEDTEWFESLMNDQPSYIRYCGTVPFASSVDVLRRYDGLLFPTYYEGECLAGTLIDVMSAGILPFVSDWHDNAYIIHHLKTGMVHQTKNVQSIVNDIIYVMGHPNEAYDMRLNALKESYKYQPENALSPLINRIR